MQNLLNQFDITKFDSGKIDLRAPQWIAGRLYASLVGGERTPDTFPEEELRLRIISDAVIAANLLCPDQLPHWVWNLDALVRGSQASEELAPIVMPAGIRYMRFEQWVVVMMPEIVSFRHAEMLATVINDLHNECSGTSHWVVDMAAVTRLPASLVGYLIGFNRGLRSSGCGMALLWIQRGIVPEALMAPLIKHFSLVKKGSFFISKAANRP